MNSLVLSGVEGLSAAQEHGTGSSVLLTTDLLDNYGGLLGLLWFGVLFAHKPVLSLEKEKIDYVVWIKENISRIKFQRFH